MNSINLDKIYEVRKDFTIIGLTGRTGSGCANVTQILEKDFKTNDFPIPINRKEQQHADDVKYEIAYRFLEKNYKPFISIKYSDILTFFILREGYSKLVEFINQNNDFQILGNEVAKFKDEIENFNEIISILNIERKEKKYLQPLYSLFFGRKFQRFSNLFIDSLSDSSKIARSRFFQLVSNNLRKSGTPFSLSKESDPEKVYFIAKFINQLIKSCRENSRKTNGECRIVIDSLRNSLEMNFFKQRYAAFYMVSVSRKDHIREQKIRKYFERDSDLIMKMDEEEHAGPKDKSEFYKQDVSNCIQKSDIHLYNINEKDAGIESTIYSMRIISFKHQLVSYLALIIQPGIITPSPQERCMQMAYTAKYNSGCISRQVGAVITDGNYSVKAIGWNNTPEGQIPCLLRNVRDLLDEGVEYNPEWYSEYEKKGNRDNAKEEDKKFVEALNVHYKIPLQNKEIEENLAGRNVPYCFKSIINSYQEGKNQVHTRSLHAEENAFLQISKYGGQGIIGGFLFTTASPCELCAKKAYQLGIKTIFYIDPYPGITEQHIITCGSENRSPKMIHFYGAIGNAYHWLFEPFMAYKDELSLILGMNVKNENQTLSEHNNKMKDKLKDLGYLYESKSQTFKDLNNG